MPGQLEQDIRERAYTIWEQEGHPAGQDAAHWLRAEAEIAAASGRSPNAPDGPLQASWAELAEMLGQLGCDILEGSPVTHTAEGFLDPKILAILLMARTLSNFKGAITLLMHNLIVEARILVRSCQENAFWIVGLNTYGRDFANKMMSADIKSKQTRAELIFSGSDLKIPEETEKRLRIQMRKFKKKHPKPKPLNPQEVALDGVLRNGYLIYAQLSADAGHPSLESLSRHILRLPDNERIVDVVPAPRGAEIIQTWDFACNAMLATCVGVNEILGGTSAGLRLRGIADHYQKLPRQRGLKRD
jgi:Protein of unknown function (DUF2934)/Family of unknown function (DUF5677)